MMSPSRRAAHRISVWAAFVVVSQALVLHAYADRPPVVALDLSRLSEVEHREIDGVALENRAVVRLLQEGFTMVAPRASAAPKVGTLVLVIRVSLAGEELRLSYTDGARQDQRIVKWVRDDPLPELHWLVAQKVVELVRSWRNGAEAAMAPGPTPAPEPLVTPELVPPSAAWRLGAGLGARSRADRADPVVAATWTREGVDWSLEGRVQGTWSHEHSLTAQDVELLVGVSRRWSLSHRWSLETAILTGPGVHHYSSSLTGDPRPSGFQAGFVLSPAAGLAFRTSDTLELVLRVAPGLAWPEISHTRAGETLWRRGPFRLEAGITVQRRFH